MPFYMEADKKYNLVLAALTGFLFFSGWWIYIDILSRHFEACIINTVSIWPGIIGSFMIIVVNCVPYYNHNESTLYDSGYCSPVSAMFLLFTSMLISFGACIWGMYIGIQNLIVDQRLIWPGIALIIQNLCIIVSNLILKFNKEIQYVY